MLVHGGMRLIRLAAFLVPLAGGCGLYFGEGNSPVQTGDDDGSGNGSGDGSGDGSGSGTDRNDPSYRRVFVTSEVYAGGALGGLAGADTICQSHARAAGYTGAYRAWLSDTHYSPATRMFHAPLDYRLVTGALVAHGWDDLVDGELYATIDRDELGNVRDVAPTCMGSGVWSDTGFDGRKLATASGYDDSCDHWSDLHATGMLDNGCAMPCTARAALYCLEQ